MKGKKGGLGAFCYLAVFAMTLLALPALLWFCRRGAGEEVTLPVVMYHRVCENEEDADEYTVSAAGLEKDLEALLAAGYTPVRLSQVLDYARSGGPLPRRPVLLVFDDGEAGFAHWAMPVLKKIRRAGGGVGDRGRSRRGPGPGRGTPDLEPAGGAGRDGPGGAAEPLRLAAHLRPAGG